MTGVVQKEIERINNSKDNQIDISKSHNNMLDVVKSQLSITQPSVTMQASPISMSSSGSNDNTANRSVNEQIIASLGFDTIGKDGGGDGDGDGNRFSNNVDDGNECNTIGKSGTRKNEFISVNLRKISINMFTGRNLHSNPYMLFNNSKRRLILAQGSDGEML